MLYTIRVDETLQEVTKTPGIRSCMVGDVRVIPIRDGNGKLCLDFCLVFDQFMPPVFDEKGLVYSGFFDDSVNTLKKPWYENPNRDIVFIESVFWYKSSQRFKSIRSGPKNMQTRGCKDVLFIFDKGTELDLSFMGYVRAKITI